MNSSTSSDWIDFSPSSRLPATLLEEDMFKFFWGSRKQQAQPLPPREVSTDSWYPSNVVSSPGSSRPATPPVTSSGSFGPRATDWPHSLSHICSVEDKSVDELRILLSDKDTYQNFFLSLEPVKTQNEVRDALRNETVHLAKENLEKESPMMELQNQCRIIRSTELAAAREKLCKLRRKKEDAVKFYSPASLLHRLEETMNVTDNESEDLHRQLLEREIDLPSFVQKYQKMRYTYYKRALTHLAAKTSVNG